MSLRPSFTVLISVILLAVAAPSGAAIRCYDCHGTKNPVDYRPVDSPFRNVTSGGFQGNHRTHMDAAATQATCAACHPGSSGYNSGHRNGRIDLSPNINGSPLAAVYRNGSTAFPQRPLPTLGSCNNVNCHMERETPQWGSPALTVPAGCGACHGAPPSGGDSGLAGSHGRHDQYYTGANKCGQCHADHTNEPKPFAHATSAGRRPLVVSLRNPDGTPGGSYAGPVNDYLPKSQNNQVGRCAGTYCHSDGTSVATGGAFGNVSTPPWGSSGPLACTACHAYPPSQPKGAGPKANSHGRHKFYGFSCSRCHYDTTHDGTSISDTGKHVNKAYDVSAPPGEGLSYTFSPTGGSCTASYCHSTAQGLSNPTDPPVYRTASWDMQFANGCSFCHSAGWHEWVVPSAGTGSHTKHLRFETGRACNMCHYNPRYGSSVCGQCHASYYGHRDESARGPEHANGVIDVAFDPNFPAPGATGVYTGDSIPRTPYGSCETLYCHSQGTKRVPPYDPPNVQPVRWGGAPMPADCTGCHGGDGSSSHPLATGAHSPHLSYGCIRCHAATVTGNRAAIPFRSGDGVTEYIYTTNLVSKHANGQVELAFTAWSAVPGSGSYTGRCMTTYCHSDGSSVATGAVLGNISSPAWKSGSPLSCAGCHGYPPAYPDRSPKANSHVNHAGYGCNACHYPTTIDGSTIANQAKHIDGRYDLAGAPGIGFSYSFATTGGSCASVSCHTTNTLPRAWAATTCGNCHNAPPGTSSHRKHFTGPAVFAVYGNASTTQRYHFNCGTCHPLDTKRDNNGAVEVELYNPAAPAGSLKALNPPTATYLSGGTGYQDERGIGYTNGSCSNIYCHSSGTSVATGQPATSAPVVWNGPAMACDSCHGNPPAYANAAPKANSHVEHGASGCNACHYAVTATGTVIADPIRHGDGRYDVTPAPTASFTYTYAASGGNCTAIACHNDGTAVATGTPLSLGAPAPWGGTIACTGCHGAPPNYATGAPKANSHVKHAAAGCQLCHAATTTDGSSIADHRRHGNGTYDVTPAPGTTFAYTYAAAGGSCSSVSCHSDGTAIATGTATSSGTATWGKSATCATCHTSPPAYATGAPKANSHARHLSYFPVTGCYACHYATTTDGRTITDPTRHGNGQYDVSAYPRYDTSFTYAFSPSGGSCSNVPCHSDGTAVPLGKAPTSPPVTWGGAAMTCSSCHGYPPAYGNGAPKANSHPGKHASYGCNVCHYWVTNDGTTITHTGYHPDNLYKVDPGPGTSFTYSFALNGGSCSSVSCHSDGTAVATGTIRSSTTAKWGTALTCASCHANPPAYTSGSPKANSHVKHGSYGCNACHYPVTTTGTTITDEAKHFNGQYEVAPNPGTTFAYTFASNGGSCSNVSCHNDGTAVATGVINATGSSRWGVPLDCGGCHSGGSYGPQYQNGSPKANSHYRHWYLGYGCQDCHYAVTTTGYTITTPSKHLNSQYDVTPGTGRSFTYAYATNTDHSRGGTCSSNYCHSDGSSVATGTVSPSASITWGEPARNCSSCHGNPPAYANGSPKANSHLAHAAYGYGCQQCHYDTTRNGTTIALTAYHPNKRYDVSGPTSAPIYSYGFLANGGTCNTYCHSDGTTVATGFAYSNQVVKWGGYAMVCGSCHGNAFSPAPSYTDRSPKGNVHDRHTAYGCQVCHYAVTTDGTTIADRSRHMNKTYDVTSDGSATFSYAFAAGVGSCSNVSCHAPDRKNLNWRFARDEFYTTSYTPNYGATNVPVTTTISVLFPEDMDPASITADTFKVDNGVTGTISYNPATRTATLTPARPLDHYNPYTITITSGIRNANGERLPRNRTSQFTTEKTALFGTVKGETFGSVGAPAFTWFAPACPSGPCWVVATTYNRFMLPATTDPYGSITVTGSVDAQMLSAPLDLSAYQSVELKFNVALGSYFGSSGTTYADSDVDVSLNGTAGPWTTVWSKNSYFASGYTDLQTVNISSLVKGQGNVVFRFRYYNTPASPQMWMQVDNIVVSGDPK